MNPRRRKLLRRGLLAALLGLAAGELALRLTPFPAALEAAPPASPEFLDRRGRPLRALLVDEQRFSHRCALTEVSPHLVAATLAAEDARFFGHHGIDLPALGRALRDALRGGPRSGASTVTQQLVKLAQPAPRTPASKLREMWLALRVERQWDKRRILTEYLNRLDYGNLHVGAAAASRFYFGKPSADLSPAEAALLAALPKAPSRLDPHRHPEAARARQQWVLQRMHAGGQLDAEALERALAEPLRLRPPGRDFHAPQFVDLLLRRGGLLPAAGGPLHTTLDLDLNRFAERTLAGHLRRLAAHHATAAAAVVLDTRTSEVLALAGAGEGETNGAWTPRSPGSTIKPFTYLLALERGAHPCTVVADVPTGFATPTGIYRPNNYNHRFHGPVSLRFALGNSLNVASIRALELAGGPAALHRALGDAGITTLDRPADYYGLGLTLGNGEVRLLELASAFATLGRLGEHRPFRLLAGEPAAAAPGRRVFEAGAAYLVADMLADNAARAAAFGLTSWLAFEYPVACKTGTSSDYRDNWCVGYTPEFTVAVWVGNPDGTPMRDITGVSGAAPAMHELIEHLHARHGTSWFSPPPGVAGYQVDHLTGRRAPPGRRGTIREFCLRPPEPARPDDYDARGRVRLSGEYAVWLGGPQNGLGDLVVAAGSATDLRILQPAPGSIYFLDGDLPPDSQWLPLRAEAGGPVEWSCASLATRDGPAGPRVQIREGRHEISARDPATGHHARTWIEVKAW